MPLDVTPRNQENILKIHRAMYRALLLAVLVVSAMIAYVGYQVMALTGQNQGALLTLYVLLGATLVVMLGTAIFLVRKLLEVRRMLMHPD